MNSCNVYVSGMAQVDSNLILLVLGFRLVIHLIACDAWASLGTLL